MFISGYERDARPGRNEILENGKVHEETLSSPRIRSISLRILAISSKTSKDIKLMDLTSNRNLCYRALFFRLFDKFYDGICQIGRKKKVKPLGDRDGFSFGDDNDLHVLGKVYDFLQQSGRAEGCPRASAGAGEKNLSDLVEVRKINE